jgi:hypothetical protein
MVEAVLLRNSGGKRPACKKAKAARQAADQQFKDAKAGDDLDVFARAYYAALRHATPGQLRDEFEAFLREAPAGRATKATTELLEMVEAVLGRNRARAKTVRQTAVQQFKDAKAGDDVEVFARAWFEALRHATPGQLRAEFEVLLREAPAGRATEATTELLAMVEAFLRCNVERVKAQNREELHRRLRASVPESEVPDVPADLTAKRCMDLALIDDEVARCVEINQ